MRWLDIKGRNPMPDKRVRVIEVRQLGLPKLVIVKTKANGGI